MIDIEYITSILEKFIETFIIKYEYCNIGVLKKFKIDSRKNFEYDEEKWCRFFLKKASLNYCAKFILLRVFEDRGYISNKLGGKGINIWKDLVKNIKQRYDLLYNIAIDDIRDEESIKGIFSETDYDIYEIDKELAKIIVSGFIDIDFSQLSNMDIKIIFRNIYPLDEREEKKLSDFYYEAPALDYILNLN